MRLRQKREWWSINFADQVQWPRPESASRPRRAAVGCPSRCSAIPCNRRRPARFCLVRSPWNATLLPCVAQPSTSTINRRSRSSRSATYPRTAWLTSKPTRPAACRARARVRSGCGQGTIDQLDAGALVQHAQAVQHRLLRLHSRQLSPTLQDVSWRSRRYTRSHCTELRRLHRVGTVSSTIDGSSASCHNQAAVRWLTAAPGSQCSAALILAIVSTGGSTYTLGSTLTSRPRRSQESTVPTGTPRANNWRRVPRRATTPNPRDVSHQLACGPHRQNLQPPHRACG